MVEMWAIIPETDNLLEVSTRGRVRSLMRDGRILKATADKKGYLRIRATINRRKISMKIHREVARAFINNPKGFPQVNHINGDKTDNSVENLEWVNNLQNAHHAIAHGLWGNVFRASQEVNEKRKTPIVSIDESTGEQRTFESVSAAERYFNNRHISDVLNGKRAHAAGQTFRRVVID